MGNVFEILGLVSSSIGALSILYCEIVERFKRAKRTQELAKLINGIAYLEQSLAFSNKQLKQANESLGYEAYDPDERRISINEKIAPLKSQKNDLTDINAKVLEEMLPLIHPIAFGLLAFGFCLQLVGLLAQ